VDARGDLQTNPKADVPDLDVSIVSVQKTYRRSFNRPTGLSDDARVFLSISQWQGSLKSLELNHKAIELDRSIQASLCIEITSQIELSNKIEIQITNSGDQSPLLCGAVCIEIDD
jgi:hypothetical protein